jgi:hypothetical protein
VSRQRVACLEGVRDRVSAITGVLRDVEPRVLDTLDPRELLPPVASCETASPWRHRVCPRNNRDAQLS